MTRPLTHPEQAEQMARGRLPIWEDREREAGRSAEADFSPVAADGAHISMPASALPQIEARFKASLDRYANQRIPTGGFLRAVLENRLMESWQRADPAARENLEWILGYVIWEIPGNCWGSPEIVDAWLKGGAS